MSPSKPARIVFGTASFGTGTSQAKFNSPETALSVLSVLRARGITDIDTARAYPVGSPGTAEVLLGAVSAHEWATISTKVTSWMPGAHAVQNIAASVDSSLAALGVDKVDIMYLHAPDRTTPFEETCRAMDAEWRKGKFARFGISNYRADEVEEIVSICERAGLVKPSVYQGRYNAIIRSGEEKLFPVLRKHGIAFYAYRSVLSPPPPLFLTCFPSSRNSTALSKVSLVQLWLGLTVFFSVPLRPASSPEK